MPSVTIQGAGSVYPTFTAGTNIAVARQAAAVINAAITNGVDVKTAMGGPIAPTPSTTNAVLFVETNNPINLDYSSTYGYVVVKDSPAPVTVTGAGRQPDQAQTILPGDGDVRVNTGGGTGTVVVSGTGNKFVSLGTTSGYAVYTGDGQDTIDLTNSQIGGRSTVEAGAGFNTFDVGGVLRAGNTILLGAGAAQVRSTGSDSVVAAAGNATVQVVAAVAETVTGGAGTLTVVNGAGQAAVNFSLASRAPVSSGSTTAVGGAGGGTYRGGSAGNNLLVGNLGPVSLQGAGNGDVLIAMGTTGMQVLSAGSGNETLLGSLSTTDNLFVAGPGNNLIYGGSGADTFSAGSGAATITSGGGPDVIQVNAITGAGARLTITDFAPGIDRVQLVGYGGNNAPAPLAAAAVNLGSAGTRITLSDGTTITFQGIASINTGFFL